MKFLILASVMLTSSAFAQWTTHFSTQISSKLSISGIQCRGGELSSSNREDTCEKGQWLVTVDNFNTCSKEGLCTELFVPSFVAKLVRVSMISVPEVRFFDIAPVSPVSSEVKAILKKYRLRDDMNGAAKVVKK